MTRTPALALATAALLALSACGTTSTPPDCLSALNKAEAVMSDAQQAFSAASTGLGGITSTEVTNATVTRLNQLAQQIKEDRAAYDSAAASCRGHS